MKTTSNIENKKEVKKTPAKTATVTKDSSNAKSSITDKSTAKPKPNTAQNGTAKEAVTAKNTKANATIIKAPTRRKRVMKKITEIHSDVVLYEHTGNLLNGYIVLLGFFMLFLGILGFQNDVVFNTFTTNHTHAITHLAVGLLSIIVGMRQNAFGYSVLLGLVLATVGVLRFIPSTAHLVIDLLNVNEATAVLNISMGFVALLLSFTDTRSYHAVAA